MRVRIVASFHPIWIARKKEEEKKEKNAVVSQHNYALWALNPVFELGLDFMRRKQLYKYSNHICIKAVSISIQNVPNKNKSTNDHHSIKSSTL